MSDWTKDHFAVRLLTGKDEPEIIYTFTAEAWYEQRKAWMAQGAFITEERIINLLENKQYFAGFLLDWAYTNPTAEDALLVAQTVIALIKGEN